jgi:hypothetical protein
VDLHPYDGRERDFRHTDVDRAAGLHIVAKVLALPQAPEVDGVKYELSFYSGGIGILDKLAITLPAGVASAEAVVARLGLVTPDAAAADEAWGSDFLWLVDDEEEPLPLRQAAIRFINEERRSFQPECLGTDSFWFANDCSVNAWTALWEHEGALSFLGFDQG